VSSDQPPQNNKQPKTTNNSKQQTTQQTNLDGVVVQVKKDEIREVVEVGDGGDVVVLVVEQPHALFVP
jgi:hypothetical protein